MLSGMCEKTGKKISGKAYLSQCVRRVLLTPKASLLGMRGFGSDLLWLLAKPQSPDTLLSIVSEVSASLESQIKDLKIIGVYLGDPKPDGQINIALKLSYKANEWKEKIQI